MKHLFVIGLGALLSAFPLLLKAQQTISPAAVRQIESLIQEKESRTLTQKKMGSQLWYALKMERKQSITPLVQTLEVETVKDGQGLVAVDIISTTTTINPILDFVKRVNGRIQSAHPQFRSVLAYIPLQEAENLAALREVHFAELWVKPQNNSRLSSLAGSKPKPGAPFENGFLKNGSGTVPSTLAGAIVSEADETHQVSSTRSMYGVNGSGVKIGVLSDSYNSLGTAATDVSQGELPGVGNPAGFTTPVTVLSDITTGSDEGRAMSQLVHDLAPGAQIYFASAFNGDADFAQQILNLRAAGCDVIVDDISYFNEPVFQDGVIAQAVNTVTASGASYFSSAGNSGNKNDNTSGVWEGDFKDGGTNSLLAGGNVLDFATGVLNNALTVAGRPFLKWSDPQGLSGNDYDLFSLSSTGTSVLASSTNVQDGNDNPLESLVSQAIGRRLVIFKKTGAAVRALHLNTNRGRLTVGTNGVTNGHNAGKSTICVAATPALAAYPNAHTTSNVTETFSSDGPRRIFYNPDTTAITPGNVLFSTNGGEKLQKPDLTAADGTKTSVSGFNPFFGTSAAAPHAAAIAALLKSKTPSLTRTQIYNALIASALDIEAPGPDENSGVGIIMANTAMAASGATPLFADVSKTGQTLGEGSFSNGNGSVDPGEVAHLKIRLRNRSTLGAQNLVAILSTNQAGVKIFNTKWELNSLAGTTDTSNNLLPFKVGIPSSLTCGSGIAFTLKLAYQGNISDTTFIPLNFIVGNQPFLNITSSLGQAPATVANVVTVAGTMTSRLTRNGIASSCAASKASPGQTFVAGTISYHTYLFANTSGISQCVSVSQSSSVSFSNLYSAVYNNSGFVQGSAGSNFLADFGSSANGTYSFTVNPGEQFTAVVNEVTQGSATAVLYNLSVSLATCAPAPTCSTIQAALTNICGRTGEAINFLPQISGGSGFYSSQVITSLPAGLSFTNGTFTGNIAAAGLYTVTIQYNDEMGCPSTQIEYSFHISDLIQAIASDDTLCAGESVVLQGSPVALPGMTYTWSDGVHNGVAFVPASTHNYGLTSTFGPCVLTDSIIVVVNPVTSTPSILPSGPTSFCEGGSVVLQSSSATGNLWSNGATSQEILVNASGDFTVQTISAGCSSAVSAVVSVVVSLVPSQPVVTALGSTTFCRGDSVFLRSSSATGNIWSNGATTQFIRVDSSEILNVRVVAGACTSAVSNTVEVVVNPVPSTPTILPSGTTSFCEGGSVVLQSSSATGNLWSNGATSQEILVSASGDFTVQTISVGCSSAVSAVVSVVVSPVPSQPVVTALGSTTFCRGDSVFLQSSSATGNIWSNGVTTQFIRVDSSEILNVRVVAGACTSAVSNTVEVVVNPVPSTPSILPSGSTNFCEGGSVVLQSSSATGNLWSNGATSQEILVSQSGDFTVQTISAGCSSAVSPMVSVVVKTNPIVNAGADQTIELGQVITLTATGADVYQWSPLSGLNPANGIGASVSASPNNTTLYVVTGMSTNGCQDTDSVLVTVNTVLLPLTPPVISPGTGSYTGPLTVTISGIVGATLYYTTNGNNPRVDVPNGFTKLYTGSFQITSNTTIRAIAVRGIEVSSVRAVFLTVSNPAVCDPPVIQPGTGSYSSIQTVTMTTATVGAEIWYTSNGNLPLFTTPNSFTKKYTGAFQVDRTTTINAVTIKTGVQNSGNTRVILTINLPQSIGPVVFNPAPGLFPSAVSVSMSNIVADAQIYYTTNGNTPRTDVFNYFTKLYNTPVAISSNTTLKAMGIKTGLVNGPVTTGVYSFAPSRLASNEPELGMFPNPARERIYLNLFAAEESEGLVEVFDLQGRRLLQQSIQADGSQHEIDVRNLPAGNYLVKVQAANRVISRLLVKE